MTILNTARQFLSRRPTISPFALMAGVSLFILLFDNATLWGRGFDIFSGHQGQLAILFVAMFTLSMAIASIFGSRYILQPFLALMLILAASTSYYVDKLGVTVDRDMIQNVVTTTVTESKHLITFSLVSQIFLWGILPAILVLRFKLKPKKFVKSLLQNTGMFCLGIALTVALLLSNFKTYSSVARERKDFMGSQQPGAAIVGTIRYIKMINRSKNIVVAPLGEDARKGARLQAADKPLLSIIVVGETARNQNFSLNGYDKKTNPELEKRSIVNYTDVNSCGTATAVSLPCMFSKFDRATYSYGQGLANETLVDVIKHSGINIEWWDNNTGDKGIASRIKTRKFTNTENDEFCSSGECTDGIFYQYLEEAIANITEDTVLVLHQIGSHGPTYYLRYPDEFEIFKPACKTAEFKDCTPEEITNVYDNTIVYTDHILAKTIDLLARQDDLLTSLVYVSDHGESLGESGLYLHGAPYLFAPETQTKVPMLMWMSPAYKAQFQIDQDCLQASADKTISHANLFHSVLGLLDIDTKVRNPELDLFSTCKAQ